MSSNGGRHGPEYDAFRQAVIERETHCHLCGEPVDKRLSGRHPMGPTVDHVTPLADGGHLTDPANGRLAHRQCNSTRGARRLPALATGTPSRDWLGTGTNGER